MVLEAFCRLSNAKPDGVAGSHQTSAAFETRLNNHSNSAYRNGTNRPFKGPRMAILESGSSQPVHSVANKRSMLVSQGSTGGWGGWEGASLNNKTRSRPTPSSGSASSTRGTEIHGSTAGLGDCEGATLNSKVRSRTTPSSTSVPSNRGTDGAGNRRVDRAFDKDAPLPLELLSSVGVQPPPQKSSVEGHQERETPAADCAPVAGFLQRMSKGIMGAAARGREVLQRQVPEGPSLGEPKTRQVSEASEPSVAPPPGQPPEFRSVQHPEPSASDPVNETTVTPHSVPVEKDGEPAAAPLELDHSGSSPGKKSHASSGCSNSINNSTGPRPPQTPQLSEAPDSAPEPCGTPECPPAPPVVQDVQHPEPPISEPAPSTAGKKPYYSTAQILLRQAPMLKETALALNAASIVQDGSSSVENEACASCNSVTSCSNSMGSHEQIASKQHGATRSKQYIMSKLQKPVPSKSVQHQDKCDTEAPMQQRLLNDPRKPLCKSPVHGSVASSCPPADVNQPIKEKMTKVGAQDHLELNSLVLEYLKAQGVGASLLQTLHSELGASKANETDGEGPWSTACALTRIFNYATHGVLEVPVYALSGQTYRLAVHPWTTVRELKHKIETQAGIMSNELRLVHESAELTAQDQCLAQCLGRPCQAELSMLRIKTRLAVTAAEDTVKLWNLGDGALVKTLDGHGGTVRTVSADWSQMRALCGSTDGALKVWDLKSGMCLKTCTGHEKGVCGLSVDWGSMVALSAGGDALLKMWDLKSGRCLRTMKGHNGTVWAVAADWKAQRALSGSGDHTLRMWNLVNGCSMTTRGHYAPVTTLSVSWTTMRALSGSGSDCAMKLWDIEDLSCLKVYYSQYGGHTWNVIAVSVDWVSQRVLSGSGDGMLRIWELGTGECTKTLGCDSDDDARQPKVHAIDVDWCSGHALCAGGDNTLRVWDLESGRCSCVLEGHSQPANAVVIAQMDESS